MSWCLRDGVSPRRDELESMRRLVEGTGIRSAVTAVLKYLRCCDVERKVDLLFWLQSMQLRQMVRSLREEILDQYEKTVVNGWSNPKMELTVPGFVHASPWKRLSEVGMGTCW